MNENPYNFYRPLRTTFDTIVHLLDELERANKTQELMLRGGMLGRSNAGSRFFFFTCYNEIDIRRRLNEYPYHWIEGVKTVLALRKRSGNENLHFS